MIEVYKIYDDDIDKHVATIYYNQTTKLYNCELIIPDKTPLLFARCDGGIHPGECPNPPQECIDFWLRDRVIPENRQMLKEILHANNIYKYDWRVLIKLNHGKSVCDPYRVEVEEIEE